MPKRKGFLYEWMCDKEHIRAAIVFGSKDKHDRRDVRRVLADVDGYTDRVYDLLQTQTFVPAHPRKREIFDNSSRKWRTFSLTVVPATKKKWKIWASKWAAW